MSEPIKTGDQAYIIYSETWPEAVGWVVSVISPAEPTTNCQRRWMISHAPLGGFIETNIPEKWLKRIPPLSELDDVKRDEEITA